MCVCFTSYPYLSTLEARKAPRMFPTEAQALHRPNTKPRLENNMKFNYRKLFLMLSVSFSDNVSLKKHFNYLT